MASYLDKVQVNSAVVDNTKLSLDHEHITTGDFFQTNVSYLHEMVPGEHIKVNMETFARLNPLVQPTMGRASMRHRAFFIPMRVIDRSFTDMLVDAVHVPSDFNGLSPNAYIPGTVPTLTNESLMQAFCNASYVSPSADVNNPLYFSYKITDQTSLIYDFLYNNEKYNFTAYGRQAIKVLEALGYKIYWDTKYNTQTFSAMPLLAFAKAFMDWYFPPQYRNSATYDYVQALCNQDIQAGPITLDYLNVHSILSACMFSMYDSSYYVSAWDTPNEPTPGNYSNFRIVNIDTARVYGFQGSGASGSLVNSSSPLDVNGVVTNGGSSSFQNGGLYQTNTDAPFIAPFTPRSGTADKATVTPISQYMLHSLHALTDYMKRHQLAGSRAMDRYLARYGKALPAEKLNRTLYLGSNIQDIQIGDVMSTSSTQNANLGDFAGRGISHGNGSFEFSTDEFGYLLIITTIVPNTSYFQGIDRQVMRTSKLQFFTPEFDSLGVQPITSAEVLIPQALAGVMTGNPYEQVFGFTPRYADYKVAHDQLTGNFRVPSINGGSEEVPGNTNTSGSWHLMRVLKPLDFSLDYSNVVHSLDFVSGKSDFTQYKRLFYNDEATSPDNFTIIHDFKIDAYVPMKPLYDEYDFEDKGKKITLETNGVKLN